MFIVVYRLAAIINMTVINLAIEVLVGVIVYLLGVIILKAPIVDQTIGLIQSRRGKKELKSGEKYELSIGNCYL